MNKQRKNIAKEAMIVIEGELINKEEFLYFHFQIK